MRRVAQHVVHGDAELADLGSGGGELGQDAAEVLLVLIEAGHLLLEQPNSGPQLVALVRGPTGEGQAGGGWLGGARCVFWWGGGVGGGCHCGCGLGRRGLGSGRGGLGRHGGLGERREVPLGFPARVAPLPPFLAETERHSCGLWNRQREKKLINAIFFFSKKLLCVDCEFVSGWGGRCVAEWVSADRP